MKGKKSQKNEMEEKEGKKETESEDGKKFERERRGNCKVFLEETKEKDERKEKTHIEERLRN